MEILPHLYLGSARDAARKEQLQQLGITALLNVTQFCPNLFQEVFEYKCIPVRDTGCEDIGAYFQEAINFIGAYFFFSYFSFYFFLSCNREGELSGTAVDDYNLVGKN